MQIVPSFIRSKRMLSLSRHKTSNSVSVKGGVKYQGPWQRFRVHPKKRAHRLILPSNAGWEARLVINQGLARLSPRPSRASLYRLK